MIDYVKRLGLDPKAVTGRNEDPERLIDWFDYFGSQHEAENNYRFLSNFYEEPFILGLRVGNQNWTPREWKTGEHAFQAAKAVTPKDFSVVWEAATPSQAKALGRSITLRKDWEEVKVDVMRQVLDAKFAAESELGKRLLATGDALLIEGTWWNDRVWGVALDAEHKPGRNILGSLLMARRAELRALEQMQSCEAALHGGWLLK